MNYWMRYHRSLHYVYVDVISLSLSLSLSLSCVAHLPNGKVQTICSNPLVINLLSACMYYSVSGAHHSSLQLC